MLRFYMPLVFIALIIGWLHYRLFFKKDLKQHKNDLYLGLFFIAIWSVLYYFMIN